MAAVYVDTCAGIDPSCVAHEPTLTYAFFLVISTPTSTAQICPAVVALRSGASECIEINVNKYLQIHVLQIKNKTKRCQGLIQLCVYQYQVQ